MTMLEFYENFYSVVENSRAHAQFCERVFGNNFSQHGFADMKQLRKLIAVLQLNPTSRVLEIGCGNGLIAEYISETTGAHVTGMDISSQAIQKAQQRTVANAERLSFFGGDINTLELSAHAFDTVISIDSLYFSSDYTRTIRDLMGALVPGGQMGIYFSHGREPWVPKDKFPADSIMPDRTPLADALNANGLPFETWDFTRDEYRLAQRRKQVLTELRPQFEAEGITFIYENRMGDALGIRHAIEEGLHRRYLYHVRLPAECHST